MATAALRQNTQAESGANRFSLSRGEWFAAAVLLAPAMLFFTVTVLYPLVDTIRLSFFDIKGLAPAKWVGLGNYVKLFADPAFRSTIGTTLFFTVAVTVLSVGIGWTLAILCSLAPTQTRIARIMMFISFGISDAVVGFMWLVIFRPDEAGLLNSLLRGIGLEHLQHAWLGDAKTALWAIIATATWSGVGLPLLICFASVQSISTNVIEAAQIDGARTTSMIRHILMPLSLPGVRVSIFINLLGALRAFDVIFVMTAGGPVRSTETIGYFMFRESFAQFKLGYGAA
ncbi:MAG: sugar ABC transporter permease, partial [Devosia sp.]